MTLIGRISCILIELKLRTFDTKLKISTRGTQAYLLYKRQLSFVTLLS